MLDRKIMQVTVTERCTADRFSYYVISKGNLISKVKDIITCDESHTDYMMTLTPDSVVVQYDIDAKENVITVEKIYFNRAKTTVIKDLDGKSYITSSDRLERNWVDLFDPAVLKHLDKEIDDEYELGSEDIEYLEHFSNKDGV